MTQEPIVRHYRGATRSDAESDYRNEAVQAAEAGYLPVTHQWTTDWQGFLLAVTYRFSAVAAPPERPAPTAPNVPVARPHAPTAVAAPVAAPLMTPESTVNEFASSQPTADDPYSGFAPRGEAATNPTPQPTAERPVEEYAAPTQPAPAEEPWLPPSDESALDLEQPTDQEPAAQQPEPTYEPEPTYQAPAVEQPEAAQETKSVSQVESLYEALSPKPEAEQPAMPQPEPPQRVEPTWEPSAVQHFEATDRTEPSIDAPVMESPEAVQQPEPEVRQAGPADEAERAWEQPVYQQPSEPAWPSEPVSQVQPPLEEPAVEDAAPEAETAREQAEVQVEPDQQPEPAHETSQQIATASPPDISVELPVGRPAAPAEPMSAPEPVRAAEPAAAAETPVRIPERRIAAQAREARLTIQTMDLHCAGEPLRIIRSGFPEVPNLPVVERRRWVMQNADHIRRAVIHEPRGHHDMYGAILLPPHTDYADMTVLFMHNEGYSTMCGHGIIAITTGLIEEGLFPATEPVTTIRYEVPAGLVAANAATVQLANGDWAVQGVRFTNVPSYLAAQSLPVRPDGIQLHGSAAQYGALSVDLGFGGAYYGIVNAAELGLRVVPEQADALRHAGAAIADVLRRDHTPSHPTDPSLGFVYGTIIVDLDPRSSPDGRATNAHMRNVTIFADSELDRSPCGSGTSAILAQLHARGRIKVGQEIINAGITGEHFLGRVEAETALGPYPAVSTSIAGTAYVTGFSTFIVDNRDPLGEGFLLR